MPQLPTEKKLEKYIHERFPTVKDLKIERDEDKFYLWSSLPISEANLKMEDIETVKKLINADFKGMVSNNGLYATIYQLK